MSKLRRILTALLIGLPVMALSLETDDLLIQQAKASRLSEDAQWLKLLHYEDSNLSATARTSKAISKEFFLSTEGATNPESELEATISAFFADPEEDPETHAQCIFPARFLWLSNHLNFDSATLPTIRCEAFQNWSFENSTDGISLIFATGYFENPASYYGHMLLKFSSSERGTTTDLLDTSINYGAIIPEKENGLVYVLKGLIGGYEAGYTHGIYYERDHDYANIELRDVWEYSLNLTQEEIDLLTAHAWELIGTKFTYYYLRENCGYMVAELLELVLDKSLIPSETPWVIPSAILMEMDEYEHHGQPLMDDPKRHISRQTKLHEKFEALNSDESAIVKQVVTQSTFKLEQLGYATLPRESKIKIVDLLFDYYELRIQRNDRLVDKGVKVQLLREMLLLTNEYSAPEWTPSDSPPPEQAQRAGAIRLGVSSSETNLNTTLSYRATYFDFLSPDAGRPKYSELIMGQFDLELRNNRTRITEVDLIQISSLGLPHTGLPEDDRSVWRLRIGMDQTRIDCDECLVGSINGAMGLSTLYLGKLALFGTIDGRFQTEQERLGHIALGGTVGLLIDITPDWRVMATVQDQFFIDTGITDQTHITIDQRFGSSRAWDIRIRYEQQDSSKISASVGYFF